MNKAGGSSKKTGSKAEDKVEPEPRKIKIVDKSGAAQRKKTEKPKGKTIFEFENVTSDSLKCLELKNEFNANFLELAEAYFSADFYTGTSKEAEKDQAVAKLAERGFKIMEQMKAEDCEFPESKRMMEKDQIEAWLDKNGHIELSRRNVQEFWISGMVVARARFLRHLQKEGLKLDHEAFQDLRKRAEESTEHGDDILEISEEIVSIFHALQSAPTFDLYTFAFSEFLEKTYSEDYFKRGDPVRSEIHHQGIGHYNLDNSKILMNLMYGSQEERDWYEENGNQDLWHTVSVLLENKVSGFTIIRTFMGILSNPPTAAADLKLLQATGTVNKETMDILMEATNYPRSGAETA